MSWFECSGPRLFLLVGLSGLEPPTSRLSGVRSNRLSYKPIFPAFDSSLSSLFLYPSVHGGDKRDRTADPLLAKQVLSQLSYTPISLSGLDYRPCLAFFVLRFSCHNSQSSNPFQSLS